MGEMADYYREQEMYNDAPWPDSADEPPRITRASKWKTRDGQTVAIRDMTTEHLRNTLKMYADGRLQLPDAWFIALSREMERRNG